MVAGSGSISKAILLALLGVALLLLSFNHATQGVQASSPASAGPEYGGISDTDFTASPSIPNLAGLPIEIDAILPLFQEVRSPAWGDYDGDGDLDLALAFAMESDKYSQVYRNDGDGNLALAWEMPLIATEPYANQMQAYSVAWGDYDGDGDLDLVFGGYRVGNYPFLRLYRNDGQSTSDEPIFTEVLELTPAWGTSFTTRSLAWGDYDDDGDLDLAVGNDGYPNLIYRNHGDGTFTLNWTAPVSQSTWSVAWGDVDSDGDLDLVVGNADTPNRIYRNEAGVLSLGWEAAVSQNTHSLALGDYDGDGDLDLAAGNTLGNPNQVFRNNGPSLVDPAKLDFTLDWTATITVPTQVIAWADLDNDHDLDLLVGHAANSGDQSNEIYTNEGSSGAGWIFNQAWTSIAYPTIGLAPGDIDADGDQDFFVANWGRLGEIYRNQASSVFVDSPPLPTIFATILSRAWGDIDNDGDLDLVFGVNGAQPRRLLNRGNGTFSIANIAAQTMRTRGIALGDYDGDGDLDLALGNSSLTSDDYNRIYSNNGSGAFSLAWTAPITADTYSVAWADYDRDGDLDLAVGNLGLGSGGQANQIYRNDGSNTFVAVWTSPDSNQTRSLAWADFDSDGDLDLAVGNYDAPNQIYRNDTQPGDLAPTLTLIWEAPGGAESTYEVAWGDCDGDGDPDLVSGNYDRPNLLYRNDGTSDNGEWRFSLSWMTNVARKTTSLAWSDYDSDGDLDLTEGTFDEGIHIYVNQGSGSFDDLPISSLNTNDIAWGDADGDGDLDLSAVPGIILENTVLGREQMPDNPPSLNIAPPHGIANANFYASPVIVDSPVISIPFSVFDPEGQPVGHIEGSYSLDGGGRWHPALAASGSATTNLTTTAQVRASKVYNPGAAIPDGSGSLASTLRVADTGNIADLQVWLNLDHTRDSDLKAVLISPAGTSVTLFEGVGGTGENFIGTVLADQAATAISAGSAPFNGMVQPASSLSTLIGQEINGDWQLVLTDQFTGETGSLVAWGLRIQPQAAARVFYWDTLASGFFGQSDHVLFRLEAFSAPLSAGSAGDFGQPHSVAGPYQFTPVFASTFPFSARGTQVRVISDTLPVEGALVYRIPAGQLKGEPLTDANGTAYTTDALGYLRGHGTIAVGDTLVALLPIINTESFVLYYTNATPNATGLDGHIVTGAGVQDLTISADHPLMLFNLDISLQWDARNDSRFLSLFEFNLNRASELLYDWSNGQAALGTITVYHNRQNWNEAHIRVYASNRQRPSAVKGGFVSQDLTDPDVSSIVYTAGQVHMGAVWNRYGDAGSNLGDDWPRALAHELSHYALFLDDNYLGLDAAGNLIPVETCTGAMADPYRQDYPYDEYHSVAGWLPSCEETLSNRETGRSDWTTISTFYPALQSDPSNLGPGILPLEVTAINYMDPANTISALEDPTFYLSEGGLRAVPDANTRAFLFQEGWAIDVGRPTLDHILARGASPGDQVCVYEIAAKRLGCETVSLGDEYLELTTFSDWQPDITVTPVSSITLNIQVSNLPAGLSLQARLYPLIAPSSVEISLSEQGGNYSGTFNLADPTFEGFVRVWVAESAPRREMITDFAVGGNPVSMRGSNVSMRGSNVSMRGSNAPVTSSDGQVILFVDASTLEADQFYTLQAVTAIPSPLSWATLVGQAYRLSASANAPDLTAASLNITYMGNEVASEDEPWLNMYYWDGLTWTLLPTELDTVSNNASAQVRGEGLYVLMFSLKIPIAEAGWNLFSYPIQFTQTVGTALQSIDGYYNTVYGWVPGDVQPWKIYDVEAPSWVNTLEYLEFGQGYWITVTQSITMYLNSGQVTAPATDMQLAAAGPPATFYGQIKPSPRFTPIMGMPVTAWIDGNLCGQSQVQDVSGYGLVYAVSVNADLQTPGCGVHGKIITFRVGDERVNTRTLWQNDSVKEVDLSSGDVLIYLPIILR